MEISEHEFRRLVADADERHRAGMQHFEDALTEIHLGAGRDPEPTSRRRLLQQVGAGGAAVAIGAAVVPLLDLFTPAAAQTDEPPTDASIVAFAESIELAFATAYTEATTLQPATAAAKLALTTFANHHQQHASAFSALAQRMSVTSPHRANPKLLDVAHGQFQAARNQQQLFEVGILLETAAASTYMASLGTLKDTAAQKLAASILPVESQHAVTFSVALAKPIADLIPTFVLPDHALDPAKYPIAT